jgi:hypothetical protein
MRNKNIFNYVFILGLVILIINDHFLKIELGNWFTGKLSDFAGLLIFPMFLKYLFSITSRKAIAITAVGFLFWKSPFSQTIIDGFNTISTFQIGRVIDYTDLLAFFIFPFSLYVLENIEKFAIKLPSFNFQNKWAVNSILALAFIAFAATSQDEDQGMFTINSFVSEACATPPIEAQVGNGKIFIPTMFTPDGNGINDLFQISADSNIVQIDTFIVWNPFNYDVVFERFNITEMTTANSFDGTENNEIKPVLYFYQISVSSQDSISQTFMGNIASLPCEVPLALAAPLSVDSCAFSTQYDFTNGYDATVDSGEDLDCLEQ